jgi:hypothetical protein
MRKLQDRLDNYSTGLPSGAMILVRAYRVENVRAVERRVHNMLGTVRVSHDREWFRVTRESLKETFEHLEGIKIA